MVTKTGRQDRGTRLLMALSISVLLLTLAHSWQMFSSPFDGVNINFGGVRSQWTPDGVVVLPMVAQPGGVQPNDVVTAINGRSMSQIAQDMVDFPASSNQPLPASSILYTVQRNDQTLNIPVAFTPFPLGLFAAQQWGNLIVIPPLFLLAAFVLWRTRNSGGRSVANVFFSTTLCLIASVIVNSWPYRVNLTTQPAAFWGEKLLITGTTFVLIGTLLHFTLTFPRPHPIIQRRRAIIPLLYIAPWLILAAVVTMLWVAPTAGLLRLRQWSTSSDWIIAGSLVLVAVLQVANYRFSRHDPVAQQQVRWVVFGYALTIIVTVGLTGLPRYLFGQPVVSRNYFGLLTFPFLICMAVAVLRYRLFDIDLLINRALVHGTLTVLVVAVYVLIVVPVPALLHAQSDLPYSIVAAGLIAIAFQPVREWLQRAVNRLMYGERDEPYAVLSQLGRRLETTLLPQDVGKTIVEVVSQTLKLPYAAISLRDEDIPDASLVEIASTSPPPAYPLINLPLTYQRTVIGELRLAPRTPGEPLAPADYRLLLDLARQSGIAMHAVQQTRRALNLATDLQRSRERLVTAREEERRRLRRDLHDGLGPQLASQTLSLDAAAKLIRTDPARAEDLLHSLREQSQQAVADIRELVYELRPPTLDDLGLYGAIQQLADRLMQLHPPLKITLQARDDLPHLTAAVEVAAYRITQEALTNVVRHAGALACRVTIRPAGSALIVEIADNGHGVEANRASGVGLQSMRERAEELGGHLTVEPVSEGGTLVRAELPLPPEEAPL